MKYLLTCILVIGMAALLHAQKASVSGSVSDTFNFKTMAYSAVSLMRKHDSILVAHQFANTQSLFSFNNIDPDTYVLRITRPTFADYEEEVILKPNEQKNMGAIALYPKANLLRDVIVREKRNAITIKGDTTEFLVDSFLVNKNSNVEDLLKKLPGLQVDKNGKITAQGQEVKKVLVDGEEFFGDDPTVATRNIKATNVEAVQVFDKKSEEAAFTGIEDGTKEKTINLKLKEDAKKGYFGKVSAGVGLEGRYEHDAMFNKFKNKQKISAFAAASNTNKTGLSWDDEQKYGSGSNMSVDEETGNVYSYYSGNSESFDGVGIPNTFYAGGVYTDKFKTDTHSVNLNLKYQQLNVSGFNNNFTKYILPDTLYFNNQLNRFTNTKQLTKGAGKYEWKIDSLTKLKISANGKQFLGTSENSYITENLNINNERVNDNNRIQTNNNAENVLGLNVNLGRKFKTKGRSLAIDLNQITTNGNTDGFLTSSTNFYEGGNLITQNIIDQKKLSNSKINTFTGNINYTEPLSTKWFIVADYNTKFEVNESDRTTLDKDVAGNYTIVVDSLSNSLRYDIAVNRGGLALKYNTKNIIYSIGGKVSYTDLQQRDVETGQVVNQYFLNIFPAANFQYKIRNTSSFNIGYNGRTRQPSLQQIQPIIDNSNPLSLVQGNPNLQQSFSNSINVSYNNYKAVSGSGMYVSGNVSFIQNDFSQFSVIDQFGRNITQTVNVNGNKSAYVYGNYWASIKGTDIQWSTNLNMNFSENHNFINGLANVNYNFSSGPYLGIYYSKDEKIETGIYADWDYNRTRSTLRSDVVTAYWVSTYSAYAEYKIKKKYTLASDCDFNYRQRTEAFPQNFNTIIWNASVSRSFLKSDNLVARVGCKDILNQNVGFRRNATSNYVNENTYSILKRYFMFSLTWNFTKGGAGAEGGTNEN